MMHTYACVYILYIVSITTPPENATVCRGSDVTISCGYDSDIPLDSVWLINATFLQPSQIMNLSSYEVNNPTTPVNYSLAVFSINGTTKIRCAVASQSLNITAVVSAIVTVTVTGMYIMYIHHFDTSHQSKMPVYISHNYCTGFGMLMRNQPTQVCDIKISHTWQCNIKMFHTCVGFSLEILVYSLNSITVKNVIC